MSQVSYHSRYGGINCNSLWDMHKFYNIVKIALRQYSLIHVSYAMFTFNIVIRTNLIKINVTNT